MNKFLQTKVALPAITFIGLVITIAIVKLQPQMTHSPADRAVATVNAITVNKHSLRPTIIGYGTVAPDLTLKAKAEVSGRVTYLHPELKKGAILPEGTLVVKIDDKDYQLALRQANADLLSNQASLKEMQLTIENTQLDLQLAQEKFKVRQAEYKRLQKLRKSGAVSQSKLDAERQNMLAQQQEVQQLENKQTTLPSDIEVIKAKIDISKAKVEQSQRDLDRTNILLPFNARVRQVDAELDQFVSAGTLLFDVSGMDKVIINAQFPMSQFRQIAKGFDKNKLKMSRLTASESQQSVFTSLGLSAVVNIAGDKNLHWQAKVERISDNVDAQSRTIGVVVSVSGSYENIEPGVRPPLLEGNYMEVKLQGAASEFLVLPRFAIHQQQIYRIDDESKLQRVTLTGLQLQDELALLHSGLNIGDKIITSDVFPAVNGMKVESIADAKTTLHILQWVEAAQ